MIQQGKSVVDRGIPDRRDGVEAKSAVPDRYPTQTLELLLRELVAEVRGLRADFALRSASPSIAHVTVLSALADAMGEFAFDLPFNAAEVIGHAVTDFALDQALKAVGVRTVGECGALFRTLRDRDLGGLRLVRDRRSWRLVRCT
jgi:hypothetical protein